MSVEAKVYSARPRLTAEELVGAARDRGLAIRFLDSDGCCPAEEVSGRLTDDHVVIGWPSEDEATTAAVDRALDDRDKQVSDDLGKAGKLGWCELYSRTFDYESFWRR